MKKTIIIILILIANQYLCSQNLLDNIEGLKGSTVTIFLDENTKSGSGFIISDGKIVTNLHVIEGNNNGYVVITGTKIKHKIEGYFEYDNRNDLVILSVPTLKGVPLILADEVPTKGDKVFLFENPIISNDAILEGEFQYSSGSFYSGIIKTSIPLKFGNSGGALLNTKGQVVGIVFGAFITSAEALNTGWAIDVSVLKNLLKNKNEAKKNLNIINGAYYYLNQFRLNYDVKNYTEALSNLNKSIELNPQMFASYYNRANLNLKLNNIQSCIDDCNKSIEIIPNFVHAIFIRGLAKVKLTTNNEAIKDFNKCIQIDVNFSPAYSMRGLAKANLKNFSEAVKDLDTAIKIEPNNSLYFISRGGIKFFSGNKKEGCQDFQKAKELGHTDAQKLLDKFCT